MAMQQLTLVFAVLAGAGMIESAKGFRSFREQWHGKRFALSLTHRAGAARQIQIPTSAQVGRVQKTEQSMQLRQCLPMSEINEKKVAKSNVTHGRADNAANGKVSAPEITSV